MITFIIQARSGSTRMPNKILLPFYKDKSILDLLIDKLKQVDSTNILIATSTNPNCNSIEDAATKHGVICFRGSEDDVLQRFIDAAEANHANSIIRICSDNPFLELASIKTLVKAVVDNPQKDYISFDINGTPSIKTHYGFWTEYVTLSALKKVRTLTDDKLYHEHVTNYIYSNSHLFDIAWIDGPTILKGKNNIRLTIDTPVDFNNARMIYSNICTHNPYPSIEDIVSYLDNNKDYYYSMKNQILINSK